MSVINKMLRDLDQRQGAHSVNTEETPKAQRGTRSVPVQGLTPSANGRMRRSGWIAAGVLIAGVGAGMGTWWLWPHVTVDAPAAVPVASVATPASVGQITEPRVVAASEPVSVPQVVDPEPPPARAPAISSAPESVATVAPVAVVLPRVVIGSGSAPSASTAPLQAPSPAVSLRMEPMLSTRKALDAVLARSASPAANAPASPSAESNSPAQRQQQASTDALAQVQSLWNSGDHVAAQDLMQRSVDAAERSVKAGSSTVGNPVLLSLVRESVRMQMTQSRFAAVWEQLTRLESVLGSAPDLWALRANTAQRLGHHQDSVNAYRIALQSNPLEQRWLLGSAVSLAALGQISQAAEMAERARSVGEISRDVQAYLRQLGVPLKDK